MPHPLRFMLAFVTLCLLGLAVFSAMSFASKPPVEYPMPPLGPTLGDPPPHAIVGNTAVTFVDDDPGWDWDNTCEEEIAAWLVGRGLTVARVTLTLESDDHTLPIGMAYPSAEDPEALVLSGCEVTESGLACRVAVAASASSAALDAAASVVLAAAFAMPPVPVLLAVMAGIGLLAIHLDRFHPDTVRWRVMGALALYAGAALAYLADNYYLAGVDAAVWAEAIGGQGEAQATLAQGRAFLTTLATWGLWLILPLGYLSLLAQGLLAHPPVGGRPETTIAQVRTRGR